MEKSIYKYILKHTARDQIFLLILTAISMPLIYIGLEIPKLIINNALGGVDIPDTVFGYDIDQLQYLFILCFAYLGLALFNGILKYFMSVYRGVLGERMLRRFRYTLYNHILRFPLAHFRRISSGELIPIITSETKALGGFIGDSIALPAFQGGLLLTYLIFIFNQGVWLGLAAIALYPPQMIIIPRLQRKINALAKKRILHVRKLSDHIGETVSGINDIHSHYTRQYEQATISHRLGQIFLIRFEIYKKKYFVKFLNNFLAVLTPFFFYSMGGYMVLQGELSLGALVAVLAAYKDLSSPWKELLKFYQITQDVKVKHAQIIEQFDPPGLMDPALLENIAQVPARFDGPLIARRLSFEEDVDNQYIDRANLNLALHQHIALMGTEGKETEAFSHLLARLIFPSSGQFLLDDQDTRSLSEAIIGQRFAYCGYDSYVFNTSVAENLLYGLKHQPVIAWERDLLQRPEREREIKAALAAGNSADDPAGNWVDFERMGIEDSEEFEQRASTVLKVVQLEDDVFQQGLRGTADIDKRPELAAHILQVRQHLASELNKEEHSTLLESFDPELYNSNLSVAENVLFGSPLSVEFELENLSSNDIINSLLQAQGLDIVFLNTGLKLTKIMLELFADVDEDDDLFRQFSFITADDFPEYERIISEVNDKGLEKLNQEDHQRLITLTYKLTPARHRLGLIDDEVQPQILTLRKSLRKQLGEENPHISFFDSRKYNPAITIQDNIIFGRISYGVARAQREIDDLIKTAVEDLGFRNDIIRSGLDFVVGAAGSRLSITQRQKIVVARCLLKDPDVLIVNGALSALSTRNMTQILDNIIAYRAGNNLIWVLDDNQLVDRFDTLLTLKERKLTEQKVSSLTSATDPTSVSSPA